MGYFQGIVCENAHKVARRVPRNGSIGTEYCGLCGAKAHDCCPACSKPVRGGEVPPTIEQRRNSSALDKSWPLPWYCHECGKPYPWTLAKIAATEALVEELGELTTFEREGLRVSIADLMADTPNSDLASLRWKRALIKLVGPAQEIVTKVLSEIATAAIKGKIGL